MNLNQFLNAVAKETGRRRRDIDPVARAVFKVITNALVAEETVTISNFGIFSPKDRAPGKGINLQTREPMVVPGRRVVIFRPSGTLKDKVRASGEKK